MIASSTLRPSTWLISPEIDLMFCCGGLVWLLFLAHLLCSTNASFQHTVDSLTAIGALGTILLGETHTVATLAKLYRKEASGVGTAFLLKWLPAMLFVVAVVSCVVHAVAPVLLKIYLLLIAHHFTAQTYGIIILYSMRHGFQLSPIEKCLLRLLMQLTCIYYVVRQCTYRDDSGTTFMGQQIPFWGPIPTWVLLCVGLLLALALILVARTFLVRYKTTGEVFPFPAAALTISGVAIFLTSSGINQTLWLYVPAFFHGSQYLVVTTIEYLKSEGLIASVSQNRVSSLLTHKKTIRYWGLLTIAAIGIFSGLPRALEQLGVNYNLALVATFTTIQFHHIISDGMIWHLRKPETRRLLV